jgi:hypothetical protein
MEIGGGLGSVVSPIQETMPQRSIYTMRYAALVLLLITVATNHEDQKEAQKAKQAPRWRSAPASVVPVLGIRG